MLSCTRQLIVSCCFASRDGESHCLSVGTLHWAERVDAVTASAVRQSTRRNRLIRDRLAGGIVPWYDTHASTVCRFQRGICSSLVLNRLDAVYVADAGNLAEVLLQAGEVPQIDGTI